MLRFLFLLGIGLLPAISATLLAQGTAADYARVAKLSETLRNTVFKESIEPHWLDGAENAFWYRNRLPDGGAEFLLVETATGQRAPAFDHEQLADALGRATRKTFSAAKLPLHNLAFNAGRDTVCFQLEGAHWAWQRADHKLEKLASPPAGKTRTLTPYPSKSGGAAVSVTFVNTTGVVVQCVWINPKNERVPYAKIQPGERVTQGTFSGHVWIFTDAGENILDLHEAGADVPVFEITRADAPKAAVKAAKRPFTVDAKNAVSPDGKWRAEIRGHNVWLVSLARSQKKDPDIQLSFDGTPGDSHANGFYWSPDSGKLVALRVRQGEHRKIYMVESSPKDQLQPKLHTVNYPKPGDVINHPRPRLFDIATRKTIPIDEALFPNPWTIDRLRWAQESDEFFFLYNQRGHQVMRVLAVAAATGKVRTVVEETSPTFIDYAYKTHLQFLDDTGELVWMSERDGWNHLWLYDTAAGQVKTQLTRGKWVVKRIEKLDTKTRQVWFFAVGVNPGEDPYYEHLCRVNLDGTGFTVLTQGDGTHRVQFSPQRGFFLDTWSRVDEPPVTVLRKSADGSLVCLLEKADISRLLATGWRMPERFCARGRDGKTDIYGVIIRPSHFDPAKKYPVIEHIYAGPHGAFVPKAFSSQFANLRLAELGFIVVRIDGMGTNWRSRAFHDVAWKNLVDAGFPDRIAWMKAAAQQHPELDLSRVGIYGGSAGGQNALGALLFHGDFYKAAVADSGCHDNRIDKTWWNEAWMGWPIGPEYAAQSNVTHAKNLRGKLLLIVGELDKNVDPATTMQVVNALIAADKDFDLLIIPGGGHCPGMETYGLRRHQDFFVRHLHGVEPRQ